VSFNAWKVIKASIRMKINYKPTSVDGGVAPDVSTKEYRLRHLHLSVDSSRRFLVNDKRVVEASFHTKQSSATDGLVKGDSDRA